MFKRLAQTNPYVKLGIGAAVVLGLLLIGYRFGSGIRLGNSGGTISVNDAEVCLRQGETIYFTVTFGSEAYLKKLGMWEEAQARLRTAQAFVINASTHVGTIRGLSLDDKVFLVAGGVKYPAVGAPLALTTHHDTYLVFFPRYDMAGKPLFEQESGQFDILIEGIGRLPERLFTFHFPLPASGASRPSLARLAMLLGAALAAMLVTCTPCLVGSLTVGSVTMGTAWGSDTQAALEKVRAEMVKKTLLYLAALILAYLGVAIATNAYRIDIDDLRPVEVVGGVLLLAVGLSFLRSWRPVVWLENAAVRLALKVSPGFRKYVTDAAPEPALGSGASSAMGASLAMVCSVAGAPTLATAIVLPLMIYAGLGDLYWSILVLLVYLVVCAVPFFLIAIGLGEALLTMSLKMRGRLLIANAFLLVGLGVMLILSPQAVADTLSTPARLLLAPLSWLP